MGRRYPSAGQDGPSPQFVYWPKMKAQSEDEVHAKGAMIRDGIRLGLLYLYLEEIRKQGRGSSSLRGYNGLKWIFIGVVYFDNT